MNIEGHAFKPNAKEMMAKRQARYKEISELRLLIDAKKTPQYGRCTFTGTLSGDAQELSEEDICLIMDNGNLCFGGDCTKTGNKFTGCYWTD